MFFREWYTHKKARLRGLARFVKYEQLRARNLTGLEAARTHVFLDGMTSIKDGDFLDIGTECAIAHTVRMADTASCLGRFATNFANLRHNQSLHYFSDSYLGIRAKASLL